MLRNSSEEMHMSANGAHPGNVPATTQHGLPADHGTDFDQSGRAASHTHTHTTAPVHTHTHTDAHRIDSHVIATESVPAAVQKVYEQPIVVETKQYVPVVMEKTLEQDAMIRKTEQVQGSLERREWVNVAENVVPEISQEVIQLTAPKEIHSEIRIVGMGQSHAVAPETVINQLPHGELRQVDAVILAAPDAGIKERHLMDNHSHSMHSTSTVTMEERSAMPGHVHKDAGHHTMGEIYGKDAQPMANAVHPGLPMNRQNEMAMADSTHERVGILPEPDRRA